MTEFLDLSPYVRTLFATIFVVAIAVAGMFVYKKRLMAGRAGEKTFEIISRHRVSQRAELLLVKVDDCRVLVGLTNGGIALTPLTGGDPAQADFRKTLSQEIEKSLDGNTL